MVMMMKIALEMNRSNWHEICQDVAGGSILVTGASSLKGSGDRVMPTARRRGGGHNLWLWFSDSPHCDFFFLEATNLSLALNLTPILCWTLMLPSTINTLWYSSRKWWLQSRQSMIDGHKKSANPWQDFFYGKCCRQPMRMSKWILLDFLISSTTSRYHCAHCLLIRITLFVVTSSLRQIFKLLHTWINTSVKYCIFILFSIHTTWYLGSNDDDDDGSVGWSQSSPAKIIISSPPACQLQTTFFTPPCTARCKSKNSIPKYQKWESLLNGICWVNKSTKTKNSKAKKELVQLCQNGPKMTQNGPKSSTSWKKK